MIILTAHECDPERIATLNRGEPVLIVPAEHHCSRCYEPIEGITFDDIDPPFALKFPRVEIEETAAGKLTKLLFLLEFVEKIERSQSAYSTRQWARASLYRLLNYVRLEFGMMADHVILAHTAHGITPAQISIYGSNAMGELLQVTPLYTFDTDDEAEAIKMAGWQLDTKEEIHE